MFVSNICYNKVCIDKSALQVFIYAWVQNKHTKTYLFLSFSLIIVNLNSIPDNINAIVYCPLSV